MKKILNFTLILFTLIILVGCLPKNEVEEPLKYVVTFDTQGGSVVEQQLIEEGSLVTKPNPDPTRLGYNFIHWYLSNEDIPYNFNFPVIQNITLTAKWEQQPNVTFYTVSFDSNGGSEVADIEVLADTTLAKPADPMRDGYKFLYWYVSDPELAFNFLTPITEPLTLIAKWEEISNSTTLASFDYSGYSNYYNGLSGLTSDSAIIIELADILRDTLTSYKGYNTSTEYNWVLNTTKGGQYILYDTSSAVFDGNWITSGWNSGGSGPSGINVDREHIWPANNMQIKPAGNERRLNSFTNFVINTGSFDDRPSGTERGHYSDLHNMWNAERTTNQSLHSDHYFGNTGTTGNPNRNGQLFYPGDEYIGDIARVLFYMTITYPHLTLVTRDSQYAGVKGNIYYGYLDDLLEWNALDPVSPEEIARNNKIHQNQGNRNPFIDFYYDGLFAEILFSYGDPEVPYVA